MKSLLQRATFLMSAILPFGLATALALLVFFGGAGQFFGHGLDFYGLPSFSDHLAAGLVVFAVLGVTTTGIVAIGARADKVCRKPYVPLPALLAFLAVAARSVIVVCFGHETAPDGDNGFAWSRAIGHSNAADYHSTIPCWMNYSFLLRILAVLFGNDYRIDLSAGVVMDGISTVLVFMLAFRVTGKNSAAALAASLLALNPALTAYALAGTPEHLATACFLMAALLFHHMVEDEMSRRGIVLCASACGLALGVGNSIKPIFPLVGTAMAMALVIGANRRARLAKLSCALAVAYVVQFGVAHCITAATESAFAVKLSDKSLLPHTVVVGLNRQGEGQVGIGNLSRTVQNGLRAGMSMDEAAATGYRTVQNDWHGHLNEIPGFLARKFIWAWQDFNRPLFYFKRDAGHFLKSHPKAKAKGLRKHLYRHLATALSPANGLIYLCIMAAGTYWAVVCGLRMRNTRAIDLFVVLMPLGFFCMLTLMEAQSRYKCLVLPFVFIFVSQWLGDCIGKRGMTRAGTGAN